MKRKSIAENKKRTIIHSINHESSTVAGLFMKKREKRKEEESFFKSATNVISVYKTTCLSRMKNSSTNTIQRSA